MRAVNLLPSGSTRSHTLPGGPAAAIAVAAPVVAVGLVVGGYLLEHGSVADKRRQLAALTVRADALPRVKHSGAVANPLLIQQAAAQLSALDSALADRLPWDTMLTQLAEVVPSNVWLTTLSISAPSSAGSSSSSSATGFSVGGYTYSQDAVAHLLQRLALLPSISGVTLTSATSAASGNTPLVEFQVTASVDSPATNSVPGASNATSTSSTTTTASGTGAT